MQAFIQGLFDRQLFDHRFNDQITRRQLVKIIIDCAGADQLCPVFMHQLRRVRVQQPVNGGFGAVRLAGGAGRQIKQQYRQARIRDLGRDTAAHCARTNNRNVLKRR